MNKYMLMIAAFLVILAGIVLAASPKPVAYQVPKPPIKPPVAVALPKVETKPPIQGFCHPDPQEPDFYFVKTTSDDGWKKGDQCYSINSGISKFAEPARDFCKGGTKEECEKIANSLFKL